GNPEIQNLVPERQLMAHVLVEITARIVPEKSPVDVAVRIELMVGGLSFKGFPDDVFRGHIRKDRTCPLGMAMRRVAKHMTVNRGNSASIAALDEIGRVGVLAHGTSLMADLNCALSGPL